MALDSRSWVLEALQRAKLIRCPAAARRLEEGISTTIYQSHCWGPLRLPPAMAEATILYSILELKKFCCLPLYSTGVISILFCGSKIDLRDYQPLYIRHEHWLHQFESGEQVVVFLAPTL